MLGFRLFALISFCLIGIYLNNAWAKPAADEILTQLEVDEILTQLDKNYYYPQQTGLSKLRARVSWQQLDVASGSGKFLRNPDFMFTWKVSGYTEIRDFEFVGDPAKYSIHELELKDQIKNYGELIIPLTLRQKFFKYSGQLTKKARGRESLLLSADSDGESITSYHLMINKKKMKIETIRFKQRFDPHEVSGMFRYEKLDGKWVIAESKSRFTMGELDYQEKSTYRYKKFDEIWLVHRIDQVLEQGDRIVQSHRFKITDVRNTF